MCGIVFAKNKNGSSVNEKVIAMFEAQKNRGVLGFGLFGKVVGEKKFLHYRTTNEAAIRDYMKYHQFETLLFHHRHPTSTDNTITSAHPIILDRKHFEKTFIGVHNGVIGNASELRTKHLGQDIAYSTVQEDARFNDSEAGLIEFVDQVIVGTEREVDVSGGAAFVIIEMNDDKSDIKDIYLWRKYNPITYTQTENGIYISSEKGDGTIPEEVLYRVTDECTLQMITGIEVKKNYFTAPKALGVTSTGGPANGWQNSKQLGFQMPNQTTQAKDEKDEKEKACGLIKDLSDEIEAQTILGMSIVEIGMRLDKLEDVAGNLATEDLKFKTKKSEELFTDYTEKIANLLNLVNSQLKEISLLQSFENWDAHYYGDVTLEDLDDEEAEMAAYNGSYRLGAEDELNSL